MKKVVGFAIVFFLIFPLIVASMMVVVLSAQNGISNERFLGGDLLPPLCLQYKRQIEDYIVAEGILNVQDHTYILLAIMAQESGCDSEQTPDVFQSSESLGFAPNTLDTQSSIQQGVRYFAQGYAKANDLALTDIRFVIQGYNFGYGFLDYVRAEGVDVWDKNTAYDFSQTKGGNYGDRDYVEHVLRFLKVQTPVKTGGIFSTVPLVGTPVTLTQGYEIGQHWGIDVSVGFGSIVVAADAGEVTEVHGGHCPDYQGLGSNCGGGYGNGVTIKHSNGLYARYGHLQADSLIVQLGDQVKAGQKLGLEGSSGRSSGSHLHFEVRVDSGYNHGDTKDPLEYIIIPGVND